MSSATTPDKPVEGSVQIQRKVEDVFHFYQNFKNLPRFLGDVMQIEITGPTTSRWTIEGPFGIRIHWNTEVTELIANKLIRYELAGSGVVKAVWTVSFTPADGPNATVVHEALEAPMGRLELALMAMIGKYPAAEVQANLQRLKQFLETGLITDTSYAVSGKFDGGVYNPPETR